MENNPKRMGKMGKTHLFWPAGVCEDFSGEIFCPHFLEAQHSLRVFEAFSDFARLWITQAFSTKKPSIRRDVYPHYKLGCESLGKVSSRLPVPIEVEKLFLETTWIVRVFKRSKKTQQQKRHPLYFPAFVAPEAPTVSVPGKTDHNLHRPFPLLLYPRLRRMEFSGWIRRCREKVASPFSTRKTHAPNHGGWLKD